MAAKVVQIEGIGSVSLYKRRGSKTIRISIGPNGTVRVTLPFWSPYVAAIAFAKSKAAWVQAHLPAAQILHAGQPIGRTHTLSFEQSTKPRITTQVRSGVIRIYLPHAVEPSDPVAQAAARKAAIKILRYEANQQLPPHLAELARTHGFTYASVSTRQLKSRWGSCSSAKEITLNIFLMQLPWELIDYVLIHELVHTRIMAHGEPFWAEVRKYLPDVDVRRKAMRKHQPYL